MRRGRQQRPEDTGPINERIHRWERATGGPLTASTVAFLGAYAWPILEPGLDATWRTVCEIVVWAAWTMLVMDLAVRLYLAPNRWAFVRRNPLDLFVVLLPILRPLRVLRLVTVLSAMNRHAGSALRGRVGTYLVGSVSLVVFVASLAVLDAERKGNGTIHSLGDALWWSMTTVTTVGYGDTIPVTVTGRLIAVALMLAGIAVLGVVTASFASWLVERVYEADEKGDALTRADIQALRVEVRALRDELNRRESSQ